MTVLLKAGKRGIRTGGYFACSELCLECAGGPAVPTYSADDREVSVTRKDRITSCVIDLNREESIPSAENNSPLGHIHMKWQVEEVGIRTLNSGKM